MYRQEGSIANSQPFGPQWSIDKKLGQGSYGTVFQVSRNDAGEAILSALKWIPLPGEEREVFDMQEKGMTLDQIRDYYGRLKDDFSKEIQLLYKLRGNSHIVSIEDYRIESRSGSDAIGYDIYILMELLTPLPKWLRQSHNATFNDILSLGKDICDALTDCANLSIVHRDIKPDNIFVTSDGRFKLGDFGIARRLNREDINASQRVGNLGTMSPEVFHGKNYDQRADLYSLGLVLYRLVNGQREPFIPPYPEVVTPEVATKANEKRLSGNALQRPEYLPESLDRLWDVIQKACEYEPENRYQSALEMRQALQSIDNTPALNTAIASVYHQHTNESASSFPEKAPGSSDSDSLNGTLKRTPSSFLDSNSTMGRASQSEQNKTEQENNFLDDDSKRETVSPMRKKHFLKWLIPAVAIVLLSAVITIVIISRAKDKLDSGTALGSQIDNQVVELDIQEIKATSVKLSWYNPRNLSYWVSCYDNDICIHRTLVPSNSFVQNGLVPGHSYDFSIQRDESNTTSIYKEATTLHERTVKDLPSVHRVYLAYIRKDDLSDSGVVDLEKVDLSIVHYSNDNTLILQASPMDIQPRLHLVNISFETPSIDRSTELVVAITVPGIATFSQNYTLNIQKAEKGEPFYFIPLDELLSDIYSALSDWPESQCILRIYLDGMSVDKKNITINTISKTGV